MRLPADRYTDFGRFQESRWSDADHLTRSVSEGVTNPVVNAAPDVGSPGLKRSLRMTPVVGGRMTPLLTRRVTCAAGYFSGGSVVSIFSVLRVADIDHGGFQAGFGVQEPDAASISPPVFSRVVEAIFQAARGPGFEIGANLLGPRVRRRDHDMHMIRPAVDGVQLPAAMSACFGDLGFHGAALRLVEEARILGHCSQRIQFSNRIGKFPAVLILHPATFIAR